MRVTDCFAHRSRTAPGKAGSRRARFATVFLALISLLFMQLAVARYVCPVGGTGGPVSVAAAEPMRMPCAESMVMMPTAAMDEGQPALCHAQCKAEMPSLDKYELPAPVAISAIPASFTVATPDPVFSDAALQAPHLTRATAPPVAIQNCCLRI